MELCLYAISAIQRLFNSWRAGLKTSWKMLARRILLTTHSFLWLINLTLPGLEFPKQISQDWRQNIENILLTKAWFPGAKSKLSKAILLIAYID